MIDKDDVRDQLGDGSGGAAYAAMLAIARTQLLLGMSVIADSPMAYGVGYRRAEAIATEFGARLLVVECYCSDPAAWRARVDTRRSLGLPGHHPTSWDDVEAVEARATDDPPRMTAFVLRVDTAAPVEDCQRMTCAWIAERLADGSQPR